MVNWQNQHRDPFGAAFAALFQQAGARRVSGFDRPSPDLHANFYKGREGRGFVTEVVWGRRQLSGDQCCPGISPGFGTTQLGWKWPHD